MQKFQDTGTVRIINGDQTFTCPSEEFISYELTYSTLAAGQRIWNADVRCLLVDGNQLPDLFSLSHPEYFEVYLGNIARYQVLYEAAHATQPTLVEVRNAALSNWNTQINQFICQYFDTGTQISFLKLYLQLADPTQKAAIETVDVWVSSVMAYYYAIKAQFQAAATIDELATIQAAIDVAERYGPSGSVLAVPSVHLGDFY